MMKSQETEVLRSEVKELPADDVPEKVACEVCGSRGDEVT